MLLVFFGESISFTTSYSFFTYKKFFLSFQTKKNCVNKLHVTLFFYSSRLSALHRATEIESQENVCSKLVEMRNVRGIFSRRHAWKLENRSLE